MIWLAAIVTAAAYALRWYSEGMTVTPDGKYYLARGLGHAVPRPYALRWALPKILGGDPRKWVVANAVVLVLTGPLLFWYFQLQAVSRVEALVGVALYVGLPGVWRLNVRYPVLVDAAGMAFALLSACCVLTGAWWAAVGFALIGAAVCEKSPVFAAAFSFSCLPLLGLLVVAAAWVWSEHSDDKPEWLRQPLAAAREFHKGQWLDATKVFLPWGAVGVLVLISSGWRPEAWVALALGYGSLYVANDMTRLYQWAAPALIPVALCALPMEWAAPILAAHLLNPWGSPDV